MNKLKIVKGYPSNSASPTDILNCIYEGKEDVIAKVYLKKLGISLDGGRTYNLVPMATATLLDHEAGVYGLLRDKLGVHQNVRNILPFKEHIEFDFKSFCEMAIDAYGGKRNQVIAVNSVMRSTLFMINELTGKRPSLTDGTVANIWKGTVIALKDPSNIIKMEANVYRAIVTQKLNTNTLSDYMYNNFNQLSTDAKKFMNIMWVVFTTIACMSRVGINQNDLHWGNILFDKNYYGRTRFHKKKYIMCYNDDKILIDLPATPVIYDFDRASKEGVSMAILSRYRAGGNCPEYHKKRDFMRTLCIMYKYVSYFANEPGSDPLYKKIQREIYTVLIKKDNIRKQFDDQNDMSCWMSEGFNSVQCSDNDLNNGLEDINLILSWIKSYTSFKKINRKDFEDSKKYGEGSEANKKVKSFLLEFFKQMPDKETEEYIKYNLQVVKVTGEKEVLDKADVSVYDRYRSLLKNYAKLKDQGLL